MLLESLLSQSIRPRIKKHNYICNTFSKFVAGGIPDATDSNRGLESNYSKRLTSRQVLTNKRDRTWVKLFSIRRGEGHVSSAVVEVVGGGNYSRVPSLSYISVSNQSERIRIQTMFSSDNNDCMFAYNYDSDGTCNVYIYTASYSSYVYMRLMLYGNYDFLTLHNEELESEPSNYTELKSAELNFGYKTIEDLSTGVAGVIGLASFEKNGLMPSSRMPYKEDSGESLDFNNCKELGRLYCSYRSTNGPEIGGYYWGVINIGYAKNWFVQIACGAYTDGTMRMYRRMFHSAKTWTAWESF